MHDAPRFAPELRFDPDAWFESVEKATLALTKPEYARKARYGYVRGGEPAA